MWCMQVFRWIPHMSSYSQANAPNCFCNILMSFCCLMKSNLEFMFKNFLGSQKVTIASLYLDPEQLVWYQWLCECKKGSIISWSIFIEELIAYHEDIKSNSFFTQLTHLRQKGPIIEHIQQFQKLSLRVNDIL